ncbi:class I SAM-dependent methyltransferase [Chloroflexota bacterium]
MRNRTDAVKTTHETYDLIASDYSSAINELVSESWIREFEQGLLDRFLSMTKLAKPGVLDIGCGDGRDTEYLRQRQAIVVAMDISLGMIQEANKRVSEGIFCQMDMRNLGFTSEIFDGVWANGCIYHVPKADLEQVLKEVLRVLRPSGLFSFNLKVGVGEKLEKTPRSFDKAPRFYAYYSRREIKDYLKQAGFELLEIREYPEKILDEEILHLWCRKPLMAQAS